MSTTRRDLRASAARASRRARGRLLRVLAAGVAVLVAAAVAIGVHLSRDSEVVSEQEEDESAATLVTPPPPPPTLTTSAGPKGQAPLPTTIEARRLAWATRPGLTGRVTIVAAPSLRLGSGSVRTDGGGCTVDVTGEGLRIGSTPGGSVRAVVGTSSWDGRAGQDVRDGAANAPSSLVRRRIAEVVNVADPCRLRTVMTMPQAQVSQVELGRYVVVIPPRAPSATPLPDVALQSLVDTVPEGRGLTVEADLDAQGRLTRMRVFVDEALDAEATFSGWTATN
ncbi:MAG: hypothetical protein U0Q15_14235 [Kineosporiaceae bacterium]